LVNRKGWVGEPEDRKQRYWNSHRTVKARMNLIQAFKSRSEPALRDVILEFVAADDEESQLLNTGSAGVLAFTLSLLYLSRPDVHPRLWIPRADFSVLRDVASGCIGAGFSVSSSLVAHWAHGHVEIGWKPNVETLAQAIEWMWWHDIAGRQPLTSCQGCGAVFLPQSAHIREFCSYACAHRIAVRNWRKRSKQKRGKYAKAKKA
jgi:hypothetical protein